VFLLLASINALAQNERPKPSQIIIYPHLAPPSAESKKPSDVRPVSMASGPLYDERRDLLEYQQQNAAKGNPQSQFAMGIRFLHGIDVHRNEEMAREFLLAARRQGHLGAREKLLELDRARRRAKAWGAFSSSQPPSP